MERIRNFVIISHVDHGKSTLADRFLELTGTVDARKMRPQYLDQMDLERERGITIKMQPVRMIWRAPNHAGILNPKFEILNKPKTKNQKFKNDLGFRVSDLGFANSTQEFVLNLIDTPGHADFAYEVSRALAAVEGALLLVDAVPGVQAQTVSNFHLARAEGLTVIPVVNKIDLAAARISETEAELANLTGCGPGEILRISAKRGDGVPALLQAVVERIGPPRLSRAAPRLESGPPRTGAEPLASTPARALIFDSHFDDYRGVIAHVRVVDGAFRSSAPIAMLGVRERAEIVEVGYFAPELVPAESLAAGEIGYIATGLKRPDAVRVGDTIATADARRLKTQIDADISVHQRNHLRESAIVEPLPGYQEPAAVVFASVYPEDASSHPKLADALKKIRLNDAAIRFESESSDALGRGWRMGFLGLLHMEIVGERIRREYGVNLVIASPSVVYRIVRADGREEFISSAARLPDPQYFVEIQEPWVRLEVVTRERDLGAVSLLLQRTRGEYVSQRSLGVDRRTISYEAPLAEILVGFVGTLKSVTAGFGSFSYEPVGYRRSDLVRLDVLVAGERESALSKLVVREDAYRAGRALVAKLKALLPPQLFAVSIQAALGGRIIARETLPALKKDVTGYLYGGDRTRKMKLWGKQQRGKKRLAKSGRIQIPPEVFRALLKSNH